MRRAERIAAIEAGLLASAREARRRGLTIIYGAGEVPGGCCVTHSLDHSGRIGHARLPFCDGDLQMCMEWDGIETGFDGDRLRDSLTQDGHPVDRDFWRMGKRLRKVLRPVHADRVPS